MSADGTVLATASLDGTVRIYTMDDDELIAIARARLARGFTPAECREYLLDEAC